MIKILIVFSTAILILFSCKTSKQVTSTLVNNDSISRHIRDSFSLLINTKDSLHKKELETSKKTGVTFINVPCPTVNIDSACSKDSMAKVIRMLEARLQSAQNTIKINKDGSIEAQGQLSNAFSNLDTKSREIDSLGQTYILLQKEHEDSLTELHKLREDYTLSKKSKPGGIFSVFWLLPIVFAAGFILHWYLNKKYTLPKI